MNEELRILYEDEFLVVCVKPVGVLSEDDPQRACMPQLLRRYYRQTGQPDYIATVHRLDRITGGVMLFSRRREITGKLIAAVAAHQVEKEYLVWVTGDVDRALPVLSGPMELDGEPLAPAQVRRGRTGGGVSQLSIIIHQGKNRQVRRMCAQAGLTVKRLKRVREGRVTLDRALAPGAWRRLTEAELALLR